MSGARLGWTLAGAAAVPLWATWPLLASLTAAAVPPLQYNALAFGAGALAFLLLPRAPARRAALAASALATGGGLLLSNLLFLAALRHVSPAEANLVLYLWPLLAVLMAAPLGLVALSARRLLGVVLGLAGAAVVIGGTPGGMAGPGAALAFAGGLVWALVVVLRMWQGPGAPEALGPGLALGAALALLLHLALEDWAAPPPATLAVILAVGVGPLALANLLWDGGVRRGDRVLLATLAYATPLAASLLLVLAGRAEPTAALLLGALLVAAGGLLAR